MTLIADSDENQCSFLNSFALYPDFYQSLLQSIDRRILFDLVLEWHLELLLYILCTSARHPQHICQKEILLLACPNLCFTFFLNLKSILAMLIVLVYRTTSIIVYFTYFRLWHCQILTYLLLIIWSIKMILTLLRLSPSIMCVFLSLFQWGCCWYKISTITVHSHKCHHPRHTKSLHKCYFPLSSSL